MRLHLFFLCPAVFALSACQTPPLPPEASDVNDKAQLAQLQNIATQNQTLTTRITALEARQNDLERSIAVLAGSVTPTHPDKSTPSDHQRAQQAFAAGQYAQAVHLLQPYSSGHSGNDAAAALWLLARSHEKLAHCESSVQTAKLFARRFPTHVDAPDAWLLVARCQTRIQQTDSARETLRYLIATYPRSRAAQSARSLLK